MRKQEIYNFANYKLSSELKCDVGKISLNSDLTTASLFKEKLDCKTVFSNREDIIICGEAFILRFVKERFPSLICLSNYKDGDLIMIGGVVTWGVYSTLLKKKKFTLPLLTLVHVICTFGLIIVFPQFLYEYSNGQLIKFDIDIL